MNLVSVSAPHGLSADRGHAPDGMLRATECNHVVLGQIPLSIRASAKYRHGAIRQSDQYSTLHVSNEKKKEKDFLSIVPTDRQDIDHYSRSYIHDG